MGTAREKIAHSAFVISAVFFGHFNLDGTKLISFFPRFNSISCDPMKSLIENEHHKRNTSEIN